MDIRMLKADQGDAIWLRFYDGLTYRNILIDTGPGSNRGNLKRVQEKVCEKSECIDLVVISHIDDDHLYNKKSDSD